MLWIYLLFDTYCDEKWKHLKLVNKTRMIIKWLGLKMFGLNYHQGWGSIRKWPLISSSQKKVSTDQTEVRSKHRVRSRSALEVVSDQNSPDENDLWADQDQTIVRTIVRPWPRPNPEFCPDDCALKITSDQTIVCSIKFI